MYSTYVFELDYGKRTSEKAFIKSILRNHDTDYLVGIGICVNNNPYNFEFYLFLNFEGDEKPFEDWLQSNYPEKRRKYNYFIGDFIYSLRSRGYNIVTFIGESEVDLTISENANDIFLFPEKTLMGSVFRGGLVERDFKVFLSYSGNDKTIINEVFDRLQKSEINVWYAEYEIIPGDNIPDKINEGLSSSDVGILLLSKNYLDPISGWPKSEMNYFIQSRMASNPNNIICLNLDLRHEEIPALLQPLKYINVSEPRAIDTLIRVLEIRIDQKAQNSSK